MKIFVLGATGYLGNRVVYKLVNEGHSIVCFIRKKSNITQLEELMKIYGNKRISLLSSLEELGENEEQTKFDFFLNLACDYGRKKENAVDNMLEANLELPVKFLNKLVKNGTTKILSIGTCLPEFLNMYSFSKNMFARFGEYYAKHEGIDFYLIQLQMFYGKGEPSNRFIPGVIDKMQKGEMIDTTVGSQLRDIIAVEDVIKAIIVIINSQLRGYQEIPVGTGIAPSIHEIIEFLWGETGKKSVINWGSVPMRQNEPDCVADTKILNALFSQYGGWNPVFWKEGLSRIIYK